MKAFDRLIFIFTQPWAFPLSVFIGSRDNVVEDLLC
jgi:hypothetical protein